MNTRYGSLSHTYHIYELACRKAVRLIRDERGATGDGAALESALAKFKKQPDVSIMYCKQCGKMPKMRTQSV